MNNIPQPYNEKWYEKHGINIQVDWNLLPAGLGLKQWLFDYEYAAQNRYKGYHCVWLRGWVRVIGFYVGAGVYFRGEKINEPRD